jgi:endonuclease/exonuclease/phosphatase (EEP) superfamily protein YafD
MDAPTISSAFLDTLDRQFRGRLRIRWSPRKEEWHIEQRMGRGIFEVPGDVEHESDMWVRARDGYSHVMAIKPKDWMACPLCRAPLAVPLFHTGEAKCRACARKGEEAHWRAAFYPLNDSLITYLHQIDPERANVAQEQADAADAANAELVATAERDTHNTTEALTHEHWNELAGNTVFGYAR